MMNQRDGDNKGVQDSDSRHDIGGFHHGTGNDDNELSPSWDEDNYSDNKSLHYGDECGR